MSQKERIAVIDGVRTPFCRSNGVFEEYQAEELGEFAVKELLARTNFPKDKIDEVILGNVMQPPHATNIARVISMRAGIPKEVPAYTVNRNCSSGMEAVASACNKILLDQADVIVAGGTESMSNFPVLFPKTMRKFLLNLSKAKTFGQKLKLLLGFRPSFLKPEVPEISDPICGLSMGQTAENLSRDFKATREEQDEYALLSQQRAEKAAKEGRFADEIVPIPIPPKMDKMQLVDDGVRAGQTLEALQKLRPAFDKVTGTVTAGNSSQTTDGAAALLLMSESKAKEMGLKPIGYIRAYASAGLDPSRMGMGPVYATAKVLKQTGLSLKDFDLIEINEAFASQIVALEKAFKSDAFAKEKLGLDKALGELGRDRLNVNGGAIALGHPLGASGARLIITLIKELRRRNKHLGLGTLCVGGGQGQACIVEVD